MNTLFFSLLVESLCCFLKQNTICCLVLVHSKEDLSRHDWKIIDWDVKNQNKPTNTFFCTGKLSLYRELDPLFLKDVSLAHSLLAATLSSADNLCKQFGPRLGLTKCLSCYGSKSFDILIVILKDFFFNLFLKKKKKKKKKKTADHKRMKNYPACKVLMVTTV